MDIQTGRFSAPKQTQAMLCEGGKGRAYSNSNTLPRWCCFVSLRVRHGHRASVVGGELVSAFRIGVVGRT